MSAHPSPTPAVLISEVGPRDGLQSVAAVMPTEDKIRWITALHESGLREIEVTSFVPARLMPQLADAALIVRHALSLPALSVAALVPNLQGAQAALAAGAHKITIPCSASQAHSLANVRKTREQMLTQLQDIAAFRREAAPAARLEAAISVAFGCTLQGPVPEDDVMRLIEAALAAGADEVGLSDTTGMANPAQVRRLYRRAIAAFGLSRVDSAHMHNTRGLGLANCLAAYEEGIRTFDASQAGLGGCPHAPGASGNVVTEDLVYMFEAMGLHTGIDLEQLIASRQHLQRGLPREPLYGMLPGAGLPPGFVYANGRKPKPPPSEPPQAQPEPAPAPPPKLPFEGIRVVEFTHMVMGPTCGMLLADLGAEVIKIEPLQGDNTRRLLGSGAGFFPLFNRNKKSLTLNLNTPQGRQAAHRLIATADIVSHNFRPETMAAQGLCHDTLKAINPRLIYIELRGFLPGPYQHRTALDEVVQMMGGLAYMTGPPGQPLRAGASVNDIMGGLFGAIAAIAALKEREHTGQGQKVQSALYENNAFLVAQHILQYAVTGQPAQPMPARISAWGVYDVFTVRGGEQIFLAAVTDTQWQHFCQALHLPDLLADPRYQTNNARVQHRPTLIPTLRERLQTRSAAELASLLEQARLPYAPILRPQDLLTDPHLQASGALAPLTLPNGQAAHTVLFPFTLHGRQPGLRLHPPKLGEHSAEILSSLGYSPADIQKLQQPA